MSEWSPEIRWAEFPAPGELIWDETMQGTQNSHPCKVCLI